MSIEIERKFIVYGDDWRNGSSVEHICQGYLSASSLASVRVRSISGRGFITIKNASAGLVRLEYEYEIPVRDAEAMLQTLCRRPLIEKRRHSVVYHGKTWAVDEFGGHLAGLILAEVELDHLSEEIELPKWLGVEVTGDRRYLNSALALGARAP